MKILFHAEGWETPQGAKAYQVENSRKLFERWQQRLKAHKPNGQDVDSEKDRTARKRVLVLDHCTPTPDKDAGSVTVFNIMLLLREMGYQVTFIAEDNFLFMPEYTRPLQKAGIEVLYAPFVTSVEQHLEEMGARYDLVFMFRPLVFERNIESVVRFCPNAKRLYHTVDLHFLRMKREADLNGDPMSQRPVQDMRQRELAAIEACDLSIVHSTAELELLRPMIGDEKLRVFALSIDVSASAAHLDDRDGIVFVGSYSHPPNIDAVKYFIQSVMPLLRKNKPDAKFYAVGANPPKELLALASDDIIFTGFVRDLNAFFDRMRISVAPLRYGAGIKGKIGSAMAAGLPVVATPIAVEGMSLHGGENILVAEDERSLSDAICRLYDSDDLWHRISQNGIEFAEQTWGATAAWSVLNQILVDLGFEDQSPNYDLRLYK